MYNFIHHLHTLVNYAGIILSIIKHRIIYWYIIIIGQYFIMKLFLVKKAVHVYFCKLNFIFNDFKSF